DAHAQFLTSPFRGNYVGNVEGRDLFHGEADVVVCEGFVGNVLLKASEGIADMFLRTVKYELGQTLQNEKHLALKALETLKQRYPAARKLFDQAREILGYDLAALCREGPADRLDATVYSQPALFVCSLAALELMKADHPGELESCSIAAGLSLGEYTALT